MKKIVQSIVILLIVSFVVVAGLLALKKKDENISIVTTNFPSYDFARAITKGIPDANIKMLVSPGVEIHDYGPTPQDIIDIKNSDYFIYTGGESDHWVENILNNINPDQTKVIRLIDLVETKEEEPISGPEEDHDHEDDHHHSDIDEHVWTSLRNSIKIIQALEKEFISQNPDEPKYSQNATFYINELELIDNDIQEIVKNAKLKTLVFGDRFPLRYFIDDYGLDYYAAFPGCSERTEASASTIAFLVDIVKAKKIPVIFHIELSDGEIASEIAKSTGAKVLEFHSAHNISKNDFDSGVTYAEIMRNNLNALKEALNESY